MKRPFRLCLVTNFNTHYRNGVFEAIARAADTSFIFYSDGGERYWLKEHGVWRGGIPHRYLWGFNLFGTRITPSLPAMIRAARAEVILKCINGRFALPVTYLFARLTGRPFVLWTEVWMKFRTTAHRLIWPLTLHIYRHADAIVACGSHVAEFLEEHGVDRERIFLARHAVDNERYNAPVDPAEVQRLRSQLSLRDDAKVVLFMGRLTEVKGLPYLLEGFARGRDPHAVLVLVGTGPDEDDLRAQVIALGIEYRTRFVGYVDPALTPAFYALASCLVLPSIELDHIKETWGLVVNEAFNQGLPVIASDATGAAAGGLVRHGETGFVVAERKASALSEAIDWLLADAELRARMSSEAKRTIGKWTQAGMAEAFLDACEYAYRKNARPARPASDQLFSS